MKPEFIKEGKVYIIKHSGVLCRVRLEKILKNDPIYSHRGGIRQLMIKGSTRYSCTKLKTMRTVILKSAIRFISPVCDCCNKQAFSSNPICIKCFGAGCDSSKGLKRCEASIESGIQ